MLISFPPGFPIAKALLLVTGPFTTVTNRCLRFDKTNCRKNTDSGENVDGRMKHVEDFTSRHTKSMHNFSFTLRMWTKKSSKTNLERAYIAFPHRDRKEPNKSHIAVTLLNAL